MKSKTLMALVVSVGCGIVAAVGIMRAIGNDGETTDVATSPVLLANDFLDIRTPLTAETCRVEQWPTKLVPAEVVTDLSMVEGMFNKMRLSKGLPIMISQIADQTYFEADQIPPGHKVVAIKVNEDDTISGLLKPGQQVDIIGIVDAEDDKNGRASRQKVANTFLKGIRVYSIDGTRDGSAEASSPGRRGNAVVGVLVTEKQSEQIVLVQRVGALKLVLRGDSTDADPEDNPNFAALFPSLMTDKPVEPVYEEEIVTDEAPDFVMTVYNGNDAIAHNFDTDGRLVNNGSDGFVGFRPASPRNNEAGSGMMEAGSGTKEFDGPAEFEESFEEDQYLGE